MRKGLIILLLAVSGWVSAEPFFVRVNDTLDIAAMPTGEADFQGRTQYAARCVSLEEGDIVLCYDQGNDAAWAIAEIDPYGAYENFTCSTTGLTCNVAGDYNIYIKLKFEDDLWYIEAAMNCDDPTPQPIVVSSAPAQCGDVMLQGFYWDSYTNKGYGRTKWTDLKAQAAEIGSWFDLVWLPPSAKSSGGTGYHPKQYSNQSCDWGSKSELTALIDSLHHYGCRVVADMVVNHADNKSSWCDFYVEDFGMYGKFTPDHNWITKSDEAISDKHCTTTGAYDDGYGDEANYGAARDWDHNNDDVRAMFRAYSKWMRYVIGYDGFRYDYCKGFHNSHINEYNTASQAYFSVMEMWDGDTGALQYHLNDAGWNTLTFDFATKYQALNNGIAADNYAGCRGAGLLGAGKGRYAVTFVDSHDSFQRDDNEFCGAGNSMRYPEKLLQANAYILSMPGVPCVFYPHWVTFTDEIKAMINARYLTGVHSESAVSDEAGNGYYKATITGKNGTIRLLLGPHSGYDTTPDGYTLATKGINYGVYYRLNSAKADKNLSRVALEKPVDPTPLGINEVKYYDSDTRSAGHKMLINGELFIQINDKIYDTTGHLH